MPDLRWDEVKDFFDPYDMGSLPDVYVHGASMEDWQTVLDVVVTNGWTYEYTEGDVTMPLPRADAVLSWLSRSADTVLPELRVWPSPEVLAIFRFHAEDEIDFDVDLRELQGQERLDVLCDLLRVLGRRLGKPVLMYPEGASEHPVLGFDIEADRVALLTEPPHCHPDHTRRLSSYCSLFDRSRPERS